ncbi:MAG TPA: multicopper oxidase family protein [Candidatus Limnocylindria bacterium]|jgi:suppressor of ftsI|nr:multicopper oxidase family protein [Candidatus Limnocylindria bacterium]
MTHRLFTAALIAGVFALVSCGGGKNIGTAVPPPVRGGTNGPPALPLLPEVVSRNGVASLTLEARLDANGRPAFFFDGQETAPTIRVQPGDTIRLHFVNTLPEFCAVGVMSNANLHFHGLSSAPVQPGDEVIATNAAPGGAVDYVVQINPDQPPGLYWYHPHPHGLSSWEVGNGMAGAIVVEGIASEVQAAAGLRERVIILGDVPTDPSYAAGELARRRRVAALRRANDTDAGPACTPETDAAPTINGVALATIGIRPGETQLFRVVNASGHRHFDLSIDGAQLTLVAQDGVPLHDYPGGPQSLTMSDILIPPAGRAEFLVTGPKQPAALVSKCYDAGPAGDTNPQVVLGVLRDDGGATTLARVRAPQSLRRSQFYRVALPAPAAQRTIHFEEDANGFYLDERRYDPAAPPTIVAHSGTVEEWTLENDTDEVHAFHIHQAHFVVESVNGVAQPNPRWLDTVDIPPQGHGVQGQLHPARVTVLIDFRDPVIRGTFLYHCHILDHEDGGMMAKIAVQ